MRGYNLLSDRLQKRKFLPFGIEGYQLLVEARLDAFVDIHVNMGTVFASKSHHNLS